MSTQNEYELIDRHLAGVLTTEEVARLEQLIRDDPEWARRYREAEDLSRLMRKAIVGPDGGRAPASVHRAVHRALETSEPVSPTLHFTCS